MRKVVLGAVVLAVSCAACAADPLPSRLGAGEPSETSSPGSSVVVGTVEPEADVSSAAPVPGSVPPAPEAEGTDPAVFSDPVTVAEEWMRQWCAYDWQDPRNANLDRAARFQTEAGARADRRRGDDEDTYRQVRDQRLSGRCDRVKANPSSQAPRTDDQVFLVVSARRTNLADGEPFEVETVSTVRRVVRQGDGRWLVAGEQEAG